MMKERMKCFRMTLNVDLVRRLKERMKNRLRIELPISDHARRGSSAFGSIDG
jgi:hypothetical protein